MQTQLGLAHFWQQGDLVTHATAILLLLLSIGSWALIVGRFFRQLRINLACDRAPEAFWQARNLNDGQSRHRGRRPHRPLRRMARAGRQHARDSYDSASPASAPGSACPIL
jgi:biopolymer transport protein ExbB